MTDTPKRVIDSETGESREYQERRPISYLKNGSRFNDFLQINVRAWQAIALIFGVLASAFGAYHATMLNVYEPRQRAAIREEMKPLVIEVRALELEYQRHLTDEATRAGAYTTRDELIHSMDELKSEIRSLRLEMRR